MLIQNVEILDKDKINIQRRRTKKTQILLYDTIRRSDDFIAQLKYRRNGRYDIIPHYLVTKLGMVYQIFDTNYYSNTFDNIEIDKKQIKIAIENLGWLNKNTITGVMNNWIGDPYRSEPYVRNWRNYYFWDRYTDIQLDTLSELCENICDQHQINKQIVPSQGYLEKASNFKGIVCKSNFSNIYTDINPSFDFSIFFKNETTKIIE